MLHLIIAVSTETFLIAQGIGELVIILILCVFLCKR